jgi:outer membrane lipoprotein-sorting protein
MKFLRRISTRQLLLLGATVLALGIAVTSLALATTGGGPKPDPKPLPVAVHDALNAPPVTGVSARVEFTNHLISSSSIQGSDPLSSGASGRLWANPDGRLRLELQADVSNGGGGGGGGDVQVLVDHNKFTVYDSGSNTAYKGTIPTDGKSDATPEHSPSLTEIQQEITKVMEHASLSNAMPSDVAGQPAYTVRVSPKHNGGLLGAAELAWDATHGTPLRAAIYAAGNSSPVLELTATDISYGAVPDSVFNVTPPAGTKVVNLSPPEKTANGLHGEGPPVTGLAAVQKQTSFQVVAPSTLAGLPRGEVRLISSGKDAGALATYGQGLGGVAVIELPSQQESGSANAPSSNAQGGEQSGLTLPKVSINGASGQELDTALGTVLRFERHGVQYIVAGSVPPGTALAAARGL